MKAVLDITLLGQGYYYPKARTGVYRVVENMVASMPKISAELDMSYIDTLDLAATLRYLKENYEDIDDFKFINAQSETSWAKYENFLLESCPLHSNRQKILKRFFYQLKSKKNGLSNESLEKVELYHSPYFPIPEQILVQKNIKKLLTIHDLIPIKFPQYFENRTDTVVHKIINSITADTFAVCVSENTKNDLLEMTELSDSQVFVVPLAASKQIFYPENNVNLIENTRLKYGIPSETSYVLSIATLEPRKNIETLINSFAELIVQEKLNDLYLLLVGTKGWDFEKILETSKFSTLVKERIIFTGYVPDTDLASLYSGALTFVYLSHYEGFGLPVLEAMQCGKSVICSNTSSLPEVIGEKSNAAILVSPTDNTAVSDAIFNFYKNPSFNEIIGQNGLERSLFFSWQKFAKDTWEVYQNIV